MIPFIIDTTLRDGEQAPGVVFNIKDKIKITRMLDKIGIDEVEIGTPAMGDDEIEDIKTLLKKNYCFRTSVWCRAIKGDIQKSVNLGVDGVNISFPVSDIHLCALNKDWKWVFKNLTKLIRYAKDNFKYVSIGAQDASRANKDELFKFIEACLKHDINRIRIADTVGIMNPLEVHKLITEIRDTFLTVYLEFHAHNDLGMATANTITALQSGAQSVSATINGLGERAGNAALEEIIMSLKHSVKINTDYSTTKLNQLCNFVSRASKRTIHLSKPIIGEMVLKHETGIHTKSILKNRITYQPFYAKEIGKKENEFLFGKHSGKTALVNLLKETGVRYNTKFIQELLNSVKKHSSDLKRNLSKNEILGLANIISSGK